MRAKAIHAAKISGVVVFAVALSLMLWVIAFAVLFHDAFRIPPG